MDEEYRYYTDPDHPGTIWRFSVNTGQGWVQIMVNPPWHQSITSEFEDFIQGGLTPIPESELPGWVRV
jgi:hypothetical protein